jgi:hypothetical protein
LPDVKREERDTQREMMTTTSEDLHTTPFPPPPKKAHPFPPPAFTNKLNDTTTLLPHAERCFISKLPNNHSLPADGRCRGTRRCACFLPHTTAWPAPSVFPFTISLFVTQKLYHTASCAGEVNALHGSSSARREARCLERNAQRTTTRPVTQSDAHTSRCSSIIKIRQPLSRWSILYNHTRCCSR